MNEGRNRGRLLPGNHPDILKKIEEVKSKKRMKTEQAETSKTKEVKK